MSLFKPLSTIEETIIVALLARGDSHKSIIDAVEKQSGRVISVSSIANVRNRNQAQLDKIQEKVMDKAEADAATIRNKTNNIINSKLNEVNLVQAALAKAGQQYLEGEITLKEYTDFVKRTKGATLSELVTVSKEMNTQAGAAPGGTNNPEDLAAIRTALEQGDEVTLTKLMFKKKLE